MTQVPVLQTHRLLLDGHRVDDLADSAALWGDPEVVRYIGGRPFTHEEVWARLLRYAGHWSLLGFGYWAVREKATGRFMGDVGFADFRRDIRPGLGDAPEAGWVLAPWAHGRGYASEALGAALGWAEARLGAGRTVCMIHPDNAGSLRVAQKAGYRPFARATYHDAPTVLHARTAGLTSCCGGPA